MMVLGRIGTICVCVGFLVLEAKIMRDFMSDFLVQIYILVTSFNFSLTITNFVRL